MATHESGLSHEIDGLVSGVDIQRELRQRRRPYLERTVPFAEEASRVEQGWQVIRRNKKTVRVRKAKPVDQQLEDDIWSLLAVMGFGCMSSGRRFSIPVSPSDVDVPPKQIDVLAVDDETALVVECKASEQMRPRSLQKDLNETRALQKPIREAIHRHFEERLRVCFVYVTRNIRWSVPDRERAKGHHISIVDDRQIAYYRKLADIIGPAARHQLQADLLEGSPIQGLRLNVPALRGTFGGRQFYQFAIEPDRLLKLAYVSHRAKVDAETVGTYQRLLRKKRLKDIAEHINETGGMFPTNIVVNIRQARGLRFDPSGPATDAPTVLGTLYLPNTYKCAWVIDGQHRLYGFSLSQWASKAKVPVLAFENLDPAEEVKLFVDINNKQVRVPRRLLIELEPELHHAPDQPEQALKSLHSQLAVDLSESYDSPLWGRVSSEWDTDATNRPVTLPELARAIGSSQLVGSIRNGTFYPGYLYEKDWSTTRKRAALTVEKYLSTIDDGASHHWNLDQRSGGFLCTNRGISALLRVLKAILDHLVIDPRAADERLLTPDEIVSMVREYVKPITDWFDQEYESESSRLRGRYGSGAARIYGFELMEIVHKVIPDFSPPGLEEYIQEHSTDRISYAQQMITDIEDAIRKITLSILRNQYGAIGDAWWRKGVPQTVRGQAAQRSEMSEEGGNPHQFLDLLDYKKIAELPRNWSEFGRCWAVDKQARSKRAKLAWMDTLNTIRNRVSHSGRRQVTGEEITFLEELWQHVGEELERL